MKKLLILLTMVITGCVYKNEPIHLKSTFDANQAEIMLEKGNITLTGESFMRQRGGGVVTCAGEKVALIPQTEYASERMIHIFGNTSEGYVYLHKGVSFTPDVPAYYTYMRMTTCNAQGHFKFEKLKKGKYIIITYIAWETGGKYSSYQGGNLMQQVNVTEDNQHIILAR